MELCLGQAGSAAGYIVEKSNAFWRALTLTAAAAAALTVLPFAMTIMLGNSFSAVLACPDWAYHSDDLRSLWRFEYAVFSPRSPDRQVPPDEGGTGRPVLGEDAPDFGYLAGVKVVDSRPFSGLISREAQASIVIYAGSPLHSVAVTLGDQNEVETIDGVVEAIVKLSLVCSAVVAASFLIGMLVRRRRIRQGRCPFCGYIRGPTMECSECGRPPAR